MTSSISPRPLLSVLHRKIKEFTHLFTQPWIHSIIHLTQSLTQFTHSLTLTHSLTRLPTHTLTHPLTHPPTHSLEQLQSCYSIGKLCVFDDHNVFCTCDELCFFFLWQQLQHLQTQRPANVRSPSLYCYCLWGLFVISQGGPTESTPLSVSMVSEQERWVSEWVGRWASEWVCERVSERLSERLSGFMVGWINE